MLRRDKCNSAFRTVNARKIFLALLLSFGCAIQNQAYAHASSWSVQAEASPITLRFTYSDGQPMAFSKVKVLSPTGEIFQVGNADRDGFFAFVPQRSSSVNNADAQALWTISAMGDEGHEIKATVTAQASSDIQSKQFAMSATIAWLLVASVILNFAFMGAKLEHFLRRKSASTGAASEKQGD